MINNTAGSSPITYLTIRDFTLYRNTCLLLISSKLFQGNCPPTRSAVLKGLTLCVVRDNKSKYMLNQAVNTLWLLKFPGRAAMFWGASEINVPRTVCTSMCRDHRYAHVGQI